MLSRLGGGWMTCGWGAMKAAEGGGGATVLLQSRSGHYQIFLSVVSFLQSLSFYNQGKKVCFLQTHDPSLRQLLLTVSLDLYA